jgi:hypothetical protein
MPTRAPSSGSGRLQPSLPASPARSPFARRREASPRPGRRRRVVQSHGIFDLIHPGHILPPGGGPRPWGRARGLGARRSACSQGPRPPLLQRTAPPPQSRRLRLRGLRRPGPPFRRARSHRSHPPGRSSAAARNTRTPNTTIDRQSDSRGAKRWNGWAANSASSAPIKYSSTKLLNLYFDHLTGPVRAFCSSASRTQTRATSRSG